tara:strand:- start:1116 stop:2174 length:1059 start_codon:yes stop_codon:yes gene_type:complete
MKINNKIIDTDEPTYFIADIAANHDGDLQRAKDLIYLAAEAGANAAKFQHFKAETIVSDEGFKKLGTNIAHQSSWKKSVFEIYKDASINLDWTETLKKTCDEAKIDFFTSPYSLDLVDYVDSYVPAYKIGSGDITWIEIIKKIASKNKPYILATGASNLDEVKNSVNEALSINSNMALLQCNTNYTGSNDNFYYINLNVINSYRKLYPNLVLGLSDHTPGHTTVLGAITLGARIIEKHFTDNNSRNGPDHLFSMNPKSWKEMIKSTRELENALGDGIKKIENNEIESSVVQRRSMFIKNDLQEGSILSKQDIEFLRPCPINGIAPYHIEKVIGRKTKFFLKKGQNLLWSHLE